MKKRTYEASNAAKRQICTVLKELMTKENCSDNDRYELH